jgi:protoporphyrinogen oxidase
MRSIRHGDFVVDLGRKELYSRIGDVDTFWNGLLGCDYRSYDHRVGSLYRGRILEMSGAYRGPKRGMPLASFVAGAMDLGRAWLASGFRKARTYEEYWHQRAGRRFAEALAQGYWEKFRGQRWSDMPVPEVHAEGQSAHSYSFSAIAHGVKLAARGGPAGQRRWRHPAKGTGQICSAMVERLRQAGIGINYGSDVIAMRRDDHSVTAVTVRTASGLKYYRPRAVISSQQVEDLASLLRGLDTDTACRMRSRTVVLVYLFIEEKPRFPHAWLEVNDVTLSCGRITNYAAFNGEMVPPGRTALCLEFFLDSDDPALIRSDEEWTQTAVGECTDAALIDPDKISDAFVMRLDRCNAAASWREAQETNRLRIFEQIRHFRNLYYTSRPGTDWATYAGLTAADAIISEDRPRFDRLTDPTRSYSAALANG